jgi:hypothetical protein
MLFVLAVNSSWYPRPPPLPPCSLLPVFTFVFLVCRFYLSVVFGCTHHIVVTAAQRKQQLVQQAFAAKLAEMEQQRAEEARRAAAEEKRRQFAEEKRRQEEAARAAEQARLLAEAAAKQQEEQRVVEEMKRRMEEAQRQLAEEAESKVTQALLPTHHARTRQRRSHACASTRRCKPFHSHVPHHSEQQARTRHPWLSTSSVSSLFPSHSTVSAASKAAIRGCQATTSRRDGTGRGGPGCPSCPGAAHA